MESIKKLLMIFVACIILTACGEGDIESTAKNNVSDIEYSLQTISVEIDDKMYDIEYMKSEKKEYMPYVGAPNILSCSESALTKENLVDSLKVYSTIEDEESAIKVAATSFYEVYSHCIETEQPFILFYNKNAEAWIVCGTLPPMTVGGVASIAIKKDTGEVLMLLHTK